FRSAVLMKFGVAGPRHPRPDNRGCVGCLDNRRRGFPIRQRASPSAFRFSFFLLFLPSRGRLFFLALGFGFGALRSRLSLSGPSFALRLLFCLADNLRLLHFFRRGGQELLQLRLRDRGG